MTALPAAAGPRPRRRGACPGAVAPMMVGDGLLVRVRVPAGVLPAAAARRIAALAALAAAHGNGLIELSHRGNLQIRGVTAATLPAVTAGLDALGLLAADAVSEAVRNVLTAPAAGIDADAVLDVRAPALALDARLAADAALHRLPPKFGFVVDGGGRAHLADSRTDLRFDAVATPAGPRLRVAAGGTLADAALLGLCTPGAVPDVAAAAAIAFLDLRAALPEPPRRMAGLVAAAGAAALRARIPGLEPLTDTAAPERPVRTVLGVRPGWLGVAFPFGRLTAATLETMADLANAHGTGELRLTPWRALLLPGAGGAAAEAARAAGGVLDDGDPRLAATACSGAAGCDVGTTDTHADALALVAAAPALIAAGGTLHVSGCAKGCARPGPAGVTLSAQDGRYDLGVLASPGGPVRARALDPAAAVAAVAALDRLLRANRRPGEDADAALARLAPEIDRLFAREEPPGA
ncbi:precorrin-3B synthase [Azospirillum halopraeferens]|uniref:precorrin-3B synthase n=1 Tax=Azospirillum halopraeferens TaxID=34010 RepID=UPI0003FB77C9|nr:precorrin-3B synthase [Azospirillum halopraeferens]